MTKGVDAREGEEGKMLSIKELEDTVDLYLSQQKAFVITKTMEIFLGSEDDGVKLRALELLSEIDL